MKNTKKAFSLIEILLILSITITFLVGVFYLYQKVSTDFKIKELNRELTSISSQAINLAYSSGFDTINADASAFGTPFPHDMIETSLVSIPTPSYSSWNGRYYKSPFGGKVNTWLYVMDTPSRFNSYEIRAEIGSDPAVCIAIAYEQVRNKNAQSMYINNQSIFSTNNRTGVRDKSEKEIKDQIIPACEKKDGPNGMISITYS